MQYLKITRNLLFFPLALFLLSGCKYPSTLEAKLACEKWEEKQKEIDKFRCQNDLYDGKRILGVEWIGEGTPPYKSYVWSKIKVIKRFNY